MYRKNPTALGTSTMREKSSGLPLSRVSSSASSSSFCSIRSATFQRSLPRSAGETSGQGPVSKALRAAATAWSISTLPPSATCARTSPVAGFRVSKFLPDCAPTHWPPINSFLGWLRNSCTERRSWMGSVVVAMSLLYYCHCTCGCDPEKLNNPVFGLAKQREKHSRYSTITNLVRSVSNCRELSDIPLSAADDRAERVLAHAQASVIPQVVRLDS